MSKPLTIEELKALLVGDWVWIVTLQDYYRPNDVPYGEYHEIVGTCSHYYFEVSYDKSDYYQLAYADYGTKWTAYKNKEEAECEYDSLAVELEAVTQDKANLERTIEEMNEVLKDNGITIDSDGNVNDSRVEEVKKLVAKEILQFIFDDCKGQEEYLEENKERELDEYSQYSFYEGELASLALIENEVLLRAEKYGVEVDE